MRGVFKRGKYWVVKYGSEYLGSFKNKSDAITKRIQYEQRFGIPSKSHPRDNLEGKIFGNLKVIGYTGAADKSGSRKVIVRNILTNEVKEVSSHGLKTGQNNGLKRWQSNKNFGVHFRKDIKKWSAEICFEYKRTYLGTFNTKEEAIAARKQAEKNILNKGEI